MNGHIKLDDRAGSKELYSALLMCGLKVYMCRLPYGDISFEGEGRDGVPVLVGIEHKKINDALKCIGDGRFAGHQLPGLHDQYNRVYLLLEGQIRSGQGGVLEEKHAASSRWFPCGFGNRTFRYADFVVWQNTMVERANVVILRADTQAESCATIRGLVSWWEKGYDNHRSHLAFDLVSDTQLTAANLIRPNLVRRIAKELPLIGWEKSRHIADKFKSVVDMVAAEENEWREIEGIGKGIAAKIRKDLGWPD